MKILSNLKKILFYSVFMVLFGGAQLSDARAASPAPVVNPTVSDASYSISSNSLTKVMCNALRIVTGSAGKSFAAFAIIAVGIGFFSGKVSWGLMIGVAVGIAAMFGAPSIVAAISGSDTDMQCSLN